MFCVLWQWFWKLFCILYSWVCHRNDRHLGFSHLRLKNKSPKLLVLLKMGPPFWDSRHKWVDVKSCCLVFRFTVYLSVTWKIPVDYKWSVNHMIFTTISTLELGMCNIFYMQSSEEDCCQDSEQNWLNLYK